MVVVVNSYLFYIYSNVVRQNDPSEKKEVRKLGCDFNHGISWKIILYES